MSTSTPDMPGGQRESIGDDLAGMFNFYIDPADAAKRIHHKWFWVGPLILGSLVAIGAALIRIPLVEHVMETMQMPGSSSPEQLATVMRFQRVAVWATPVLQALGCAILALILFATAAATSVGGSFRSYFNLVAGLSLISMLGLIAGTIVLKTKQGVTSMAELQPALGFDIFMPEGANKYLTAFLAYFSIFEVWWIVMAVLIISHAFRVSKGKAFTVVLPLVVVGLLFRVVMAGFQRT